MKAVEINGKYELVVPDHVADWDALRKPWEEERIESILSHVKSGDLLFDIGAEHGWMSGLFAKYGVGGESMVLVEPCPGMWPNIWRVWEQNPLCYPRGCVQALVGAYSEPDPPAFHDGWPLAIRGPESPAIPYDADGIVQVTIDQISKAFGPPRAITMDIEGGEWDAIQGAAHTLCLNRPLVWLSIHPGMLPHRVDSDKVVRFMQRCDYDAEHLATDHEEHWFFTPR